MHPFTTTIIHQHCREDRVAGVNALRQAIPSATVMPAVEPVWHPQQDVRAIIGCCLSHIQSLRLANPTRPHLVLEDDAELVEGGDLTIASLPELPANCGALLIGAQTPSIVRGKDLFHLVNLPFSGTHAVLYNLPAIVNSAFFLWAYEGLACSEFGNEKGSYESLLHYAMQKAGYQVMRLDAMPFVTYESISSRDGKVMAPRTAF